MEGTGQSEKAQHPKPALAHPALGFVSPSTLGFWALVSPSGWDSPMGTAGMFLFWLVGDNSNGSIKELQEACKLQEIIWKAWRGRFVHEARRS